MLIDALQSEFIKLQAEARSGPLYPNVTASEIREHLGTYYDFDQSRCLEDVVADVTEMLRNWNVTITHPRYLGLFNPSITFPSVIADLLTAMHNPQLASWRTSPAACEIERYTLGWLAAKFGLPENARGTFTSGGAEANLTAVIVALTRAFPKYGEQGLRSIECTPTIYLSSQSHHSFSKIAHMTGLGRASLRTVNTDAHLQMDIAHLQQRVNEDRKNGMVPIMVVGTCGTTAAGAIDPLWELGTFCAESHLWFHVDAAWGGAAILSSALRKYLAGIELADSITCDAHKWFSVPMGSGMFLCRHPESMAESFHTLAHYMPERAEEDTFDPYTYSVQWSRRFTGLKLFMSLACHGKAGYAEMLERQSRLGDFLRELLLASGWKIVNSSPLPVVCFTRDGLDVSAYLDAVRDKQIAWISTVNISGTTALRACITSIRTTERDIMNIVQELNQIASVYTHSSISPHHAF